MLQETLAAAGMLSGTLLDFGGGIGSLTFSLLERGVARAVAVDASSAYSTLAHQEAERLGRADVVRFVHADFVTVASELPAATLVTLDCVVCHVNGDLDTTAPRRSDSQHRQAVESA